MRQQNRKIVCLAYHGTSSPSPHILATIQSRLKASIPEVAEISDEALAEGYVLPQLSAYSFIVLVWSHDEREEVVQDCLNYIQRTLGKTVQAQAWIGIQESTQQLLDVQCQKEWVIDPPVPQSDGVHFTVEIRNSEGLAQWERMERSWETPNQFDDEGSAELVARGLALRHDGTLDTRVVSPSGIVLVSFQLQKSLAVRRRGRQENRETVSAYAELPRIADALQAYRSASEHKRDE